MLNKELQDFNERIRKWQEQFLDRYSKQIGELLGEIKDIKDKSMQIENLEYAN